MKIDAEIINGQLVIKDPRRAGEWDNGEWLILPSDDTNPLRRASDRAIANASAEVEEPEYHSVGVRLLEPRSGALLRERRAAALLKLRQLGWLRAEVEHAIRANVSIARTAASNWYDCEPPTWEEIGKALRVTKQAAASRYKDAGPAAT